MLQIELDYVHSEAFGCEALATPSGVLRENVDLSMCSIFLCYPVANRNSQFWWNRTVFLF